MVAAAQSSYPSPSPRSPRERRSQRSRVRSNPLAVSGVSASVVALPQPRRSASRGATAPKVSSLASALQFPWWLRLTLAAQQGSSVLVMILGVFTLSSYASVVYAEHRWGQVYENLETLRREESELIAAHEALKQNLAASAEATANKNGLKWSSPESMVFLEPTTPRPPVEADKNSLGNHPNTPFPLGY